MPDGKFTGDKIAGATGDTGDTATDITSFGVGGYRMLRKLTRSCFSRSESWILNRRS